MAVVVPFQKFSIDKLMLMAYYEDINKARLFWDWRAWYRNATNPHWERVNLRFLNIY